MCCSVANPCPLDYLQIPSSAAFLESFLGGCCQGGATNVRSTPYLRHVAETWHIWCDVAEQALVEAERPSNASSFGARLNIQQLSQSSKYITFMNRVERESTVRISGVI